MKELLSILEAHDRAAAQGRSTALATVVHLEGSSYRRPGARMLVTGEGEATGAISGGCLEGDALRKALAAIAQGRSKLVTYDTSDEEDASIGVQLGCAGVIQVLFEPIDPADPDNPVELLRKAATQRSHAIIATLFSLRDRRGPQPGTCLLMASDGETKGHCPFEEIKDPLSADMAAALGARTSSFHRYGLTDGEWTAFLQYIPPPTRIVLVGAGNDAIPIMRIADTLGWEVHVVDGRHSHAREDRFAAACQVLVSRPEDALRQIPVDERTAFVLMTHNYRYDLDMLKALLPLPLPYVGVLGPRKRLDRMLEELRQEGFAFSPDELLKLHGPTGLDIGAETAEEIALSVTAEIQAVLTGRAGGRLRDRPGGIHAAEPTTHIPKP
jgi:xanthine/CO dehydrogenase XdhC/CoxF family maturation factor